MDLLARTRNRRQLNWVSESISPPSYPPHEASPQTSQSNDVLANSSRDEEDIVNTPISNLEESIDDDFTYDKEEMRRKAIKWLQKCEIEEIPINRTKKKKVRNRDLEYNRSTLAVKKIFGLTELCDLLEGWNDMADARDSAAVRNSIANLEKRIHRLCSTNRPRSCSRTFRREYTELCQTIPE